MANRRAITARSLTSPYRVLGIAAFLCCGGANFALAAREPCHSGRFLLPLGEPPLVAGGTAAEPDVVTIDIGESAQVAIGSGCESIERRYRVTKRGTVVKAAWPSCGSLSKVRLKAKIADPCQTLQGTFRAKKSPRRKFTALRSSCGDGVVDAAGGEECEDGTPCPGDLACAACQCPVPGSTTTTVTTTTTTSTTLGTGSTTTTSVTTPVTTSIPASSTTTTPSTSTTTSTEPTTPPPDPATVAPPIDPSARRDFAASVAFLYAGSGIQTGVAPGTIEPRRVAVIRGRVLDREGAPVDSVRITILDHPELGRTRTRTDGRFDLAVNGGGRLTVTYEKDGFLPLARQVNAPWNDFVTVEDVVLTVLDAKMTPVDLTTGAMQVAEGSTMSDDDGARTAVAVFPAGVTVTMTLPDGTTQPLTHLGVRITEYTVGATGPAAMPAPLPPTTAYTYAVEFSVDEAMAAGATQVTFDRPVVHYVENFLGFPVGGAVPVGTYDRAKGMWIGGENGRVVKVLDTTGGTAVLDIDGDDVADDGADLGVTDDERHMLAVRYAAGQTLWRVPLAHFSPEDCNWISNLPTDAAFPPGGPRQPPRPPRKPCKDRGSIIGCESQTLGEAIEVTGAGMQLHYASGRTPGRTDGRRVEIELTPAQVPASLQGVELEVHVAGQVFRQSFPPAPNQRFTYEWDGKDAYGRTVYGTQRAIVRNGYRYRVVYPSVPNTVAAAWGRTPGASITMGPNGRDEALLWVASALQLVNRDARSAGLGGWTLSVHHVFDPVAGALVRGDGTVQRAGAVPSITHFAGGRDYGWAGDGGPAVDAKLVNPWALAVGAEGNLYVAETSGLRVITPDGIIDTLAGGNTNNSQPGGNGDGGLARQAKLLNARGLAIGPDGSIYVAEYFPPRVRRITPDGIINTVAGTGVEGVPGEANGDDGLATEARLYNPHHIAVARDGTLYILTLDNKVRRVGTDGIITTAAGTGAQAFPVPGTPAPTSPLYNPGTIAVDDEGGLYVNSYTSIYRIGTDGIIRHFAGGGPSYEDGIPATQANLHGVRQMAWFQGVLYFADWYTARVRAIGPDGIIRTVAGSQSCPTLEYPCGDGDLATRARFEYVVAIAFAPDGTLYANDIHRIRRATDATLALTEPIVPDESGRLAYVFDAEGRHAETRDALTGGLRWQFGYTPAGTLATIVDADGNTVTIERDAGGAPVAIIAPGGQRTTLALDANGWLAAVTNPANETNTLTYHPGGGGLLATRTDPRGNTSQFEFDAEGRLTRDEDAAGGVSVLARTGTDDDLTVTLTTDLGRVTSYRTELLPTGGARRTRTDPSGAATVTVEEPNGRRTVTRPDGATLVLEEGPDPRWGFLAPLVLEATLTVPGGPTTTRSLARQVTLANDSNPLSLTALTDTLVQNGHTWTTTYDGATRTVTLLSPEGRTVTTTLDTLGRVVAEELGTGSTPITYTWDARGRLGALQRGTRGWTFAYDAKNRRVSRSTLGGGTVTYTYDDADRRTTIALPSGRTYGLDYDAASNLTRLVMPGGPAHDIGWTPVDLQESYAPPGSAAYTRAFDHDRALDLVTLPAGRTQDWQFDAGARLLGFAYPEADVTFAYTPADGTDRAASAAWTPDDGSPAATTAFAWTGPLLRQAAWSGAAAGTFDYTWDANHALTEIALDDVPLAITRDGDGFPIEIGPFTLTRDGPGARPTLITDGTGDLTLGYDVFDRIVTRHLAVGGVTVYDATYEWDAVGRLARKTESIGGGAPTIHEYAYDADSQLELVTEDDTPVERYTYDVRGNRASRRLDEGATQVAAYDTQDRLQSQGGVTYVVDTDGFLAARGSATFVHGARGDLLAASSGGTTVSYAYDALGRRVARTVGAARTEYLYGNPEHELQVTAVRAPDGTLTLHHWDDGGRLLAIERGGERWWVATDHLGSPRVVSAADGTIVKRLEYDAWGNVTLDTAPGFDLAVGWAGGLPDPATGLVRFGLRDYDPPSGRWATRDQALLDGRQANLYAYVGNDPASATDPGGLWSIEASAYDGIGGGFKFQKTDEGIALCAELGFGVGEEIEFEPSKKDEELERDRNVTAAKLSLGVGPFTEVELSSEFEECDGDLQAKPKVKGCWLAVCEDGSGDQTVHTDPGQGHKPDLGLKLEGKLAGKFCQQARW